MRLYRFLICGLQGRSNYVRFNEVHPDMTPDPLLSGQKDLGSRLLPLVVSIVDNMRRLWYLCVCVPSKIVEWCSMQHLKMPFFVMVVPCLIQLMKTLSCRILVLCPHPLAFLDSLIVHISISCSLFIDTANLHVDLENTKKKKQQCYCDVRLLSLQMLHFGLL